jgi:hypothetical protein
VTRALKKQKRLNWKRKKISNLVRKTSDILCKLVWKRKTGVEEAETAHLESQEQDDDHQPLQHIQRFELHCFSGRTLW